ncbi:hypothetical protein A9C19_07740 [Bacillus weihaiensis]|uniref:Uncharacterized protein n=1 Tax=Bacillus weihaiensis TaxID=1547283 RepID=A0A1L3MQM4_9BACI|nr:hypothetical protein [Bacillus weihaiensis]APH04649.1 hypothetical protein A9C19_07740 [Bacillus weihaiensis]
MDKLKSNSKMPKFNDLNDRIIAEATTSPTLVIKTNLDTPNVEKENPYLNEEKEATRNFKNFFKD